MRMLFSLFNYAYVYIIVSSYACLPTTLTSMGIHWYAAPYLSENTSSDICICQWLINLRWGPGGFPHEILYNQKCVSELLQNIF